MLSSASKFRAAFPLPPYTINSSGRSATSGFKLFKSILKAASWIHPLQLSLVPVGVLYFTGSYLVDEVVIAIVFECKVVKLHSRQHGEFSL
jgi:hypothetical protein